MTTKYVSGDQIADVDPENEAAFEAAGWIRVEGGKPSKPEKSEPESD
jgi:hypothetical protein